MLPALTWLSSTKGSSRCPRQHCCGVGSGAAVWLCSRCHAAFSCPRALCRCRRALRLALDQTPRGLMTTCFYAITNHTHSTQYDVKFCGLLARSCCGGRHTRLSLPHGGRIGGVKRGDRHDHANKITLGTLPPSIRKTRRCGGKSPAARYLRLRLKRAWLNKTQNWQAAACTHKGGKSNTHTYTAAYLKTHNPSRSKGP